MDEIVWSSGAVFTLFAAELHTEEDILTAVKEIKNSSDMVSWRVAKDNDHGQLYITMIFKKSLVCAFRWFEINLPAQLNCEQRRGGIMAKQYIQKSVLDLRQRTKDENVAKCGEKLIV